ncbi:radical SAM protein [bacterium]|nr:radical SAM protein [bacterium]
MNQSTNSPASISQNLNKIAENCSLCPLNCGVDRLNGELGACGVNSLRISSINLHHGEEPPISCGSGSGTVFFSGCSLNCFFCQNYPISALKYGKEFSEEELIEELLLLQDRKAANINLVTPTHLSHLIIPVIAKAKKNGLSIPIAYNTSGYESPAILKLIDPMIDIYLYDMKYSSDQLAIKCSNVTNYVENNRESFQILIRSNNEIIEEGKMLKGVIIRHLVLPGQLNNTFEILEYLSAFKEKLHLSLMFQYFPAYKAADNPEFGRKISYDEYNKVLEQFDRLGFEKGWVQEL